FTLVSAMLAMVRGFSREILSIGSWAAAAVAAYFFYPALVPYIQSYVDNDKLQIAVAAAIVFRSEEHTSELQSRENLVCRLLLEIPPPTDISTLSLHDALPISSPSYPQCWPWCAASRARSCRSVPGPRRRWRPISSIPPSFPISSPTSTTTSSRSRWRRRSS